MISIEVCAYDTYATYVSVIVRVYFFLTMQFKSIDKKTSWKNKERERSQFKAKKERRMARWFHYFSIAFLSFANGRLEPLRFFMHFL